MRNQIFDNVKDWEVGNSICGGGVDDAGLLVPREEKDREDGKEGVRVTKLGSSAALHSLPAH